LPFNLAEAIVFIKADDSQLDKDLGSAEKKTQSASVTMAKAFGVGLAGAAVAAGAAIVGIGTEAFNVASDIDAATDQIGASLGLNGEKAKAFGQTIKDIYANNFGDSIADVGTAVENVAKGLRLTAEDPALKEMTENAFRLRDVFGVDVADSIDAVKTLTEQFGITSDEAFGMLADGYQLGMDRSGDFLDTIGEYSVQFAEGGASANNFFSTLLSGLQGGMLGTDKAADAFKEFRVRIQDGSDLTRDSLQAIGLDADAMAAGFADGSITAIDAFSQVTSALQRTEDANIQFQAGVGLLGTQFEDLGATVITNIDPMADAFDKMSDQAGTLDTKYSNLGSVIEGMWRKFQVGIAPAGEAMLAFVNENLPMIEGVVNSVSGMVVNLVGMIPLAMAGVKKIWEEDLGGMRTKAEEFMTLDKDFELFWIRVNSAFDNGGQSAEETWSTWLANTLGAFTSWVRMVLDTVGIFFENWGRTQDAFHALMTGDWDEFWKSIGGNFEGFANILLNFVEFVFGPNLRNGLVGAMNGAWEGLKDTWNDIKEWWDSTIGALLGGSSNFTPTPSGFNQQNAPGLNNQQIIDDILGGAGNFKLQGNAFQESAPSTVNQIQVNLANGGYESGFSAGEGILDAMRYRGA
jgi:hypothetical protein